MTKQKPRVITPGLLASEPVGYFGHGSPSKPMLARSDPVVKVYFSERNTAGGGVELEAFSRRERSGGLLPKSRVKPRDLVA